MRTATRPAGVVVAATLVTAGLISLLTRAPDLQAVLTALLVAAIGVPTIAGFAGVAFAQLARADRWAWVGVLVLGQAAATTVAAAPGDLAPEVLALAALLSLIGAVPGALAGGVDWDARGGSPTIGYDDRGDR